MTEHPNAAAAVSYGARQTRVPANAPFVLLILTNVALVALAARLTWLSDPAGAAGCGTEGNCSEVLSSIWARWLGVPVSALALAVYTLTLPASLLHGFTSNVQLRRVADTVLIAAVPVILGAALWFTGLMVWRLQHTCVQCLTLHGLGVVFVLLVILELRTRSRQTAAPACPRTPCRRPLMVGCLAVLILIGGQVLRPTSSLRVHAAESHDHDSVQTVLSAAAVPRVYDSGPGPDRIIRPPLIDRELRFADYPRTGPADAAHVLILFGDYACPHCHELSDQLVQAVDHYRGQLAVLHVMAPLNTECNPAFAGRPVPDRYVASCDLARLALAVNSIDPRAFEQYERWAAQLPTTPLLPEALKSALKLVSRDELTRQLSDPLIDETLARHVDVFQAVSRVEHGVPILVMDNHYTTGTPARPAELFELLEKQLGLQPPQP